MWQYKDKGGKYKGLYKGNTGEYKEVLGIEYKGVKGNTRQYKTAKGHTKLTSLGLLTLQSGQITKIPSSF